MWASRWVSFPFKFNLFLRYVNCFYDQVPDFHCTTRFFPAFLAV